MKKNYVKIVVESLLISIVGVFVVDYFSHLLFSSPMEPLPYFFAKAILYIVFSIVFLSFIDVGKKEFVKVAVAGIVVSSVFGMYYNIFPLIFDYYPVGVPLGGLTFWGMGLFGTGLAFGIVHTLAFVVGYYSSKFALHNFNNAKVL